MSQPKGSGYEKKPFSMPLNEATKYCGLGRSTLYKLIKSGVLRPRKAGARTLILTEELDNYILSLPKLGDEQ